MEGFSFPPPPPPPPKATSSTQESIPAQFNNRGRGGGSDRGRGRGGGRGNDRGGGRGSFRGRGGPQQRGGRPAQSGYQNNTNNDYGSNPNYQQQINNNAAPCQQQYQAPPGQPPFQPPPGSYVNPAFGAFPGLPPQVPSYAPVPQYGQLPVYSGGQSTLTYSAQASGPGSSPGNKRTREQAFSHSNHHPMKKTDKPGSAQKAQVAPSVPMFGGPLPLPMKPVASVVSGGVMERKQRPAGNLGLVPKDYRPDNASSDDDEEDDEDEEALLAEAVVLKDGPLSFEHNGELASLSSPSDIAEWLQERKRRWPSKRRIDEKQQEVQARIEERRRIEQETEAAIAAASGGKYQPVVKQDWRSRQRQQAEDRQPRLQHTENSTLEEAQRQLALQTQKVEELQRLLAEKQQQNDLEAAKETMEELNVVREQGLDNIDPERFKMIGDNVDTAALQLPEESTQALPGADDGHVTEPIPQAEPTKNINSDDDSGPEEASSKLDQPLRVPPPQAVRPPPPPQSSEPKPCVSFVNQGRCKYGNRCRFKHDASNQSQSKRKTLYQRLVEQEMEEENKLALRAIKYLGGVGFFSKLGASN